MSPFGPAVACASRRCWWNPRSRFKWASDQEIAEHLLISIHTVKEYGKNIRRKYQVKSRLQLISALLGRRQLPDAAGPSAR